MNARRHSKSVSKRRPPGNVAAESPAAEPSPTGQSAPAEVLPDTGSLGLGSPAAGHAAPPRARTWAFRSLGVVGGVLGGLALVELVLWLIGFEPQAPVTKRYLVDESTGGRVAYHCYASNPHGEMAPVPDTFSGPWRLMSTMLPPERLPLDDLRETPWCVRYDLSTAGLRERELEPQPPPGVTRVLLVGDSFVFGEGVPIQQTLGRQLAAKLAANVELVNAGRPGLGTAQELERLSRLAPALGATRAIVVFIANDIEVTGDLARQQEFIFDLMNFRDQNWQQHAARQWYAGSSRLARWAGQKIDMLRITRSTIQWYLDCYDPRYNAAGLERLAAGFHALAQWSEGRAVLVMYPLVEGLDGHYPLEAVHRRVAALAEQSGLAVLDLAPAFAGQPGPPLWVHPTDHHPNGRANALAAEALARWLPTVPGFLPVPVSANGP